MSSQSSTEPMRLARVVRASMQVPMVSPCQAASPPCTPLSRPHVCTDSIPKTTCDASFASCHCGCPTECSSSPRCFGRAFVRASPRYVAALAKGAVAIGSWRASAVISFRLSSLRANQASVAQSERCFLAFDPLARGRPRPLRPSNSLSWSPAVIGEAELLSRMHSVRGFCSSRRCHFLGLADSTSRKPS